MSTNAIIYSLSTTDFFFWVGKNERTMKLIKEMIYDKDSVTKQKIKKATQVKRLESTGAMH